MRGRLSISILMLVTAMALAAGACGRACNSSPNDNNNGHSTPTPAVTVSPATRSTPGTYSTASPQPPPSGEGTMILNTEGVVTVRRKGATTFDPYKRDFSVYEGDEMKIDPASFAVAVCTDRGICNLGPGTYNECCTAECVVSIAMIRRGDAPPMRRADLSPEDARQLGDSEAKIRALNLNAITTQFLITNLYSNWKLEETNDELNRLNTELNKPEAKEQLKELYLPIMRKSGDLHVKWNRLGDARQLYQRNLEASSKESDLNEKAAAHAGLADVYQRNGEQKEAQQNLEAAKEIYVRKGEQKAVEATDRRIVNLRSRQQLNRSGALKEKVAPAKSP